MLKFLICILLLVINYLFLCYLFNINCQKKKKILYNRSWEKKVLVFVGKLQQKKSTQKYKSQSLKNQL